MKITKNKNADTLTLGVSGRLDTLTAPELEEVVNTSLDDVQSLVFDLDGLEYISSAGLRVILTAQKIMNKQGNMKLKNVNDDVMEVFDITGFLDILEIE